MGILCGSAVKALRAQLLVHVAQDLPQAMTAAEATEVLGLACIERSLVRQKWLGVALLMYQLSILVLIAG